MPNISYCSDQSFPFTEVTICTLFRNPAHNKCQTLRKPQHAKQKCLVEKSSHNSSNSLLFFSSLSLWLSLSVFVCVRAFSVHVCVCVSWVEEQKVSAGLACVGGLWDSPWKQPNSQGHFLNRSSHHKVDDLIVWSCCICVFIQRCFHTCVLHFMYTCS